MNSCYRVEINGRSRYFEDESEAIRFYISKLKPQTDAELWHVSYQFSETIGRYLATQTLLDYYSVRKEGV